MAQPCPHTKYLKTQTLPPHREKSHSTAGVLWWWLSNKRHLCVAFLPGTLSNKQDCYVNKPKFYPQNKKKKPWGILNFCSLPQEIPPLFGYPIMNGSLSHHSLFHFPNPGLLAALCWWWTWLPTPLGKHSIFSRTTKHFKLTNPRHSLAATPSRC